MRRPGLVPELEVAEAEVEEDMVEGEGVAAGRNWVRWTIYEVRNAKAVVEPSVASWG